MVRGVWILIVVLVCLGLVAVALYRSSSSPPRGFEGTARPSALPSELGVAREKTSEPPVPTLVDTTSDTTHIANGRIGSQGMSV